MASFKCCKGCVPPKRSEICHTFCKEYKEEKEKLEKQKIREKKEKMPCLTRYDFDKIRLFGNKRGKNF